MVCLDGLDQGREPSGLGVGVVVQESDEIGLGATHGAVIGLAESHVLGQAEEGGPGVERPHEVGRAVGGGVVDDGHLEGGIGLAMKGVEATGESPAAVPVED